MPFSIFKSPKEAFLMGLMNSIKEGFKEADDKLGIVYDGGKAEVEIGKEESKIRDATRDIGKKMVEFFDEGKEYDEAVIREYYQVILVSRKKIEELKTQQDEYKNKLKD